MANILSPHEPPYLRHFGLSKPPFCNGANPETFFERVSVAAILLDMATAIAKGDRILSLTGAAGVGKTVLSRVLMHREEGRIHFMSLSDPQLDSDGLYRFMAQTLGLPYIDAGLVLFGAIERSLAALRTSGRRAVLLIDNAQDLPAATLAQVGKLMALEFEHQTLLQLVLVGRPDLERPIQQATSAEASGFIDGIVQRFLLPPLDEREAAQYMNHRIACAGSRRRVFAERVPTLIARYAEGNMYRINALADRSLLLAWRRHNAQIRVDDVYDALADLAFEFNAYPARRSLRQSIGLWQKSRGLSAAQVH